MAVDPQGRVTIAIHAKPGAKQNAVTGYLGAGMMGGWGDAHILLAPRGLLQVPPAITHQELGCSTSAVKS